MKNYEAFMIAEKILQYQKEANSYGAKLIAVSKTHPVGSIQEAYEAGQRIFGENKVQEMVDKYQTLPKDIEWHMIGHLQTNKVKFIAPFVSLIHSIDSLKLLREVNKQAIKSNRIISCLLQVHIAEEESKFGLSEIELFEILEMNGLNLSNVKIKGLMGMATFTQDQFQIRKEFKYLKNLFEIGRQKNLSENVEMIELSMGMSSDYTLALEEGSTMIRLGSVLFGERNYSA